MSGKAAAPAASVEIDDGAIPMEEDRSCLYAISRSGAAACAGTGPSSWRCPSPRLVTALGACLPTQQNAIVSLVAEMG